jgi:hypothetical protein
MVCFGPDASCKDAELYYYQYLCDPHEASIPPGIADHIRRCPYCRAQVDQLTAAIAPEDSCGGGRETDAGVIDALILHFAHIGEDVGCAQVRSFLPVLLIPSTKIRIPTPITVHLDDCRQCREDMASLANLDLSDEQLARLGRLYAAGVVEDPGMCRRVRPKIHAHGPAWLEQTDPQERDHVCACPRCRERVYRRRERIAAGHVREQSDPGAVVCSDISTADLFDCVVPYGLPEGPRQTVLAQDAVRAHLMVCPDCAERMQELHRTVYGIAERADSGVTTTYTTADAAPQVPEHAGSLYDGYPVHVNVVHREPAPVGGRLPSIIRLPAAVWSRATSRELRPVLAAAAIVLLVFTLLAGTRTASGLRLRGIREAVQRVENLHVTQYAGDEPQPVQELWIARAEGLVLLKNATGEALYNLNRRQKTINHLGQGVVQTGTLEPQEQASVEQLMDSMVSFAVTGIPINGKLQRVVPDIGENADGGEVYELAWAGHTFSGLAVPYRLRVVLDPATKRPMRTMMFRSMPGDGEQWQLVQTRVFEYPSSRTVDLVMKEIPAVR